MEKSAKTKIIKKHGVNDKDTGSSDVQIAVLTARIKELTEHLKEHPKDHHSRRGLIALVNRRRKLLKYLDRTAHTRYLDIIKRLKLRR